jgi:hypothetical protein
MPPELLKKIADERCAPRRRKARESVVAQQGGDMVASTPAEFAAFIDAAERRRYEGSCARRA